MTLRRGAAKTRAMPPLRATRAYPLACLLGALAACGFEPLGLWPLAIGCVAGLIALTARAATLRRALGLGWWFGLGNFCLGLNWIATAFTYQAAMPAWLGWVAVVLLSLYLAIYPALATGAAWGLARLTGGGRSALALFLAATWIAGEWLRGTMFTGFPWNPLGVIWAHGGTLPLLSRLIGTYGLSGPAVLAGGALVALAARPARIALGGAAVLGVLVAALMWPRAAAAPASPTAPLLRIVQPNIGQADKWSAQAEAPNFGRLAALSGRPGPRARLILWPEVAVPALLEQDARARAAIARLLGPRDLLLTGAEAVHYAPDGTIASATNSLFGLDSAGRLLGRYDKSHLVPYGEYLPMRPLLSQLGLSRLAPGDIDFRAGPGPRAIALPGVGKVGVQICYEIVFSGHVVDARDRPLFLFNPSNDAWFGRWGPPQHLAQARLRAIEEGLPVVRATPTGISAVIDRDGRLLARLPWRTAGAIEAPLPPTGPPTLFARAGNLLPLTFALLLVAAGFASRRRAR